MVELSSNVELQSWLQEHKWFEDAFVRELTPIPDTHATHPPTHGYLKLGFAIGGSFEAGKTIESQVFLLTAMEVRDWSFDGDPSCTPGHCTDGLELLESDEGIAFTIDLPGRFRAICSRLRIEELPSISERVQPWLSDREIYAKIPHMPLPTPRDWVEMFRTRGVEVVWRYYHGEPRETDEVPVEDYSGWYLQSPGKVPVTSGGLFFFHCHPEPDGFSVHLTNDDAEDPWVFQCAAKILGSLPDSVIHCGNCKLSGGQWLEWLEHGTLPEFDDTSA